MSIARAHMQRALAIKQSAPAGGPATAPVPGSLAEKMAAMLRLHMGVLKGIKSRSAKIEEKRGLLPEYAAYVDGVIAGNGGAQDDVLTMIMLWRLDTGDYAGALDIAAYALRHGLTMPPAIARDVAATLVEEMADAALVSPDPAMADPLRTAMDLTAESDMADEIRAKAHKGLGLSLKDSDPAQAVGYLKNAQMRGQNRNRPAGKGAVRQSVRGVRGPPGAATTRGREQAERRMPIPRRRRDLA